MSDVKNIALCGFSKYKIINSNEKTHVLPTASNLYFDLFFQNE